MRVQSKLSPNMQKKLALYYHLETSHGYVWTMLSGRTKSELEEMHDYSTKEHATRDKMLKAGR